MQTSRLWAPALACALVAASVSSSSAAGAAQRSAKANSKGTKAAPRKAAAKNRGEKSRAYGVRQVDGVMILSGGGSLSLPSRSQGGSPAYRSYPRESRGSYASSPSAPVAASGAPARVQARQKVFPMPFEAVDTSGRKVSLGQYVGKVTLIDFWATWCPPCRDEMPGVVALYEKQRAKGFDIIGISLDRQPEALSRFVAVNKMGWRQIFDGKSWQGDLVKLYKVPSIPYTVLLDRDGSVLGVGLRGQELEYAVAQALSR
jgi:thiol-disulfide isomerase/thioredoxin